MALGICDQATISSGKLAAIMGATSLVYLINARTLVVAKPFANEPHEKGIPITLANWQGA